LLASISTRLLPWLQLLFSRSTTTVCLGGARWTLQHLQENQRLTRVSLNKTKNNKTLAARPRPLLRPPALPPPSSPASSGLAALPPLAAAATTRPRSPEPRAPPTSSPGSSSSPSTRCGLFLPFLFFYLPNLKKSTRSPYAAQLALFLHSPLSLPPLALDPFAGQARARQRVQARPGRRRLPGPRGLHLGLRGRAQRADQVRKNGVLLSRVFF